MSRFVSYYARFSSVRGNLGGLPPWARTVFVAIALPGIALVGLSIVAVVVSVAALLLVAVPVYMGLRAITRAGGVEDSGLIQVSDPGRPQAKHVDVTVRNRDNNAPDEVNGE